MKRKPFLIAEISANHCGKFDIAKKLILCAKKYGADAVKLQTFTPDGMTLKSNNKYFKIKKGLWKGYTLWDLYNKAKTPLDWHSRLFEYSKKIGIKIFSTPFDNNSVDLLEKLGCPFYKIASFEMKDLNLIKRVAKTKKPMIISTGMSTFEEIKKTYFIAKKYGARDITLLYCVSNYPSDYRDFNLKNIQILKNFFKCRVGLSDHSIDNRVAFAAVLYGADVIEKHIALDNQKKGLDIEFSLKGKNIAIFRENIDLAYNLRGKDYFFRNKSENKSKIFRRSIFATENIQKGEKFSKLNIRVVRPGYGLDPTLYNKILGKISKKKIKKNHPIKKV